MKKQFNHAPLSASFTIAGIIGMIVSGFGLFPYADVYPALASWAFTVFMASLIVFLASMISMAQSEPLPHHMQALAVHEEEETDPQIDE
jgi:predicted membrane channel-forming protein YqfA (hemolysin III family)